MQEFIPRPPFDENGYAAYEEKQKKKKRTPLSWIIPAGLLLIVAGVTLFLLLRPKNPDKFCRAALKNAITDSFAGGDPLVRELGIDQIRKTLESKDFTINTVLAVQSVSANEGTGIYNLLSEIGWEPEDVPKGLGVAIGVESKKGEGFQGRIGIALSSIQLTVIRLFGNRERLTVTSPKLLKGGVGFAYDELFDTWEENPGWALLSEEKRDSVKSDIRDFLTKYRVTGILSLLLSDNSPIKYFGEGYDSAINTLLSRIRFEEAKNASGRRVQEKFHIGGEHVLCYGYNAYINAEEICKRIRAITGLKAEEFKPADGADQVEARLYITRRGELIEADLSTEFIVLGVPVPVELKYTASGDDDPQDHFTLTAGTVINEKPFAIEITKNSSKNAYGVKSQWDASLKKDGESYGITIASTFDPKEEKLNVSAKTFLGGFTVGSLEAEAEVRKDEEYEMNFRTMKVWDTYSGTKLDLSWKFTVAPKEDGFSAEAPSEIRDINHLNEQEWNNLYDEIKTNLDNYLDFLSGMF